MSAGLVWLTSNHMFGSGDFWDKSPSWFLKILKLPSFYSGNFNIFKNTIGQFIPNCPPKHVITNTNQRKHTSSNWKSLQKWKSYFKQNMRKMYKFSLLNLGLTNKPTLYGMSGYSSKNMPSWLMHICRSPSVNSYGILKPRGPYFLRSKDTPWNKHRENNNDLKSSV